MLLATKQGRQLPRARLHYQQPSLHPMPHCDPCSGQMILAVGLQRHLLGAHWRWPQPPEPHSTGAAASGTAGASEAPPELGRLLQLFWDTPAGGKASV